MMNLGSHLHTHHLHWRSPIHLPFHLHWPEHHVGTGINVGRVGSLAVAMGIGAATVTGFCGACLARADAEDGGANSVGPGSASTSESVNPGIRKPSKADSVSPTAGNRRMSALPATDGSRPPSREPRGAAGLGRASLDSVGVPSPSDGQFDSQPNAPLAPEPAATVDPRATISGDIASSSGGALSGSAAEPLSAKGQSRVVRFPSSGIASDQPIVAWSRADTFRMDMESASEPVAITSPPVASASVSLALGNILTSLFTPKPGSAPTVPADAAAAVLAGVFWRQRDLALEALKLSAARAGAVATTPTTPVTIEAEAMSVSGSGRLVVDPSASGGSAVALSGVSTVSTTVTLPDTTVLTVRVRSSEGAPDMTVLIDGTAVTTLLVEARSYSDYKFAGAIAAGSHEITVMSSTSTTRNVLYVDKFITTAGPIVDEFLGKAGSAPGSGIWTVRSGTKFDSGIQTYVAENAVLDGRGNLVLRAVKTKSGGYNSGWVWSKNNVSFGYGTLTARIKMPKGQGLWPAFWLMGADSDTVGWPQSGEIDVAELPSTSTTIYSTLHGPIVGGASTQQAQIVSKVPDVSLGYHNYWVRHLEDEITFGIDDLTLGTLTPESLGPDETWVYNRPMYAILNLGVGGPWAGAPSKSTRFPAKMLVDSVRWEAA